MKRIFDPRPGETVRVCYDGKAGRAVPGKVLKRRKNKIQVEFCEWAENNPPITWWFERQNDQSFGSFVNVEQSLMKAAFGCPGDWYSVYPEEVVK